jgi:hypothetical protein
MVDEFSRKSRAVTGKCFFKTLQWITRRRRRQEEEEEEAGGGKRRRQEEEEKEEEVNLR